MTCKPSPLNRLTLLVVCVTILGLTSCQPPLKLECQSPEQPPISLEPSENINIAIQVDATPSMAGFVKTDRQSNYEQTLEILDTTAAASWARTKAKINYYAFGTERRQITRSSYIQARKPDFYNIGGVFNDGQLTAAISKLNKGKSPSLSVIVTDLYQTDSDITSVLEQLKKLYLQQDMAVGVLGIKSQFAGTVFDIGINKLTRVYRTTNAKPDTYRPFYVMFLGKYHDIVYYFRKLQEKNSELFPGENFVIFYPSLIQQVSQFDLNSLPSEISKTKDDKKDKSLRKIRAINFRGINGRVNQPGKLETLRISADAKDASEVKYRVRYFPLPYTLPIDVNGGIQAQQSTQLYDNKEFEPYNREIMQYSDWSISNNGDEKRLTFNTIFNPDQIDDGIYQIRTRLVINKTAGKEWWEKWNFDERQFDRTNSANFNGATTLNLLPFMQGLKGIVDDLNTQKPSTAAELCFAIQRD